MPNGDLSSGGLAYASMRLAHEQAKISGSIVCLELTGQRSLDPGWFSEKLTYVNCSTSPSLYKKIKSFLDRIKKEELIIHFHGIWYPQYFFMGVFALIIGVPYVISPHGNLEEGALTQKYIKKYVARKLIFNFFIKRAKFLVACSLKEKVNLSSLYPGVLIKLLPIGVDFPNLASKDSPNTIRGEKKIIFLLTRISPEKGLINFVEAWKDVARKDWHIIISGPNQRGYLRTLINRIKQLNLEKYFTFTGFINPELRDFLFRNADIFVLPSLSENFGIVVPEAMSYCVPVLTTTQTPWTHLGIDNGCLCVDPNPIEIKRGLEKLMFLSSEELNRGGEAGRSYVLENFDWKKIARDSLEIY